MRHDDLCCQKVRVLNVVDGLAGGLHAQLVGVYVHGGQLRAGDAGEQGVVEGHDGQVFRDAQSQLAAELFQHHGKDVVADQYGGGVVRRGEQGFQRLLIGIVQGVDLHTVLFPRGDAVLEQGHLIAPLALCGEQHGVADPEIRNAAVSHFVKVIGGFLPGKGVVIVNVDSLVGGLRRLAHNDMEQPLVAQIRRHRAVLFGVEQDEPIRLCVGHHALDGVQHLGIVLPGDDGVHIPPLVAELPDAADDLQMKGVFVDIPLRGGQEIAVNGYFTSVLGAPALNMGVFVGIIAGFVGGVAYNKYYNFRKLPDALAFFNGKRFVPMVVIAYSVVISIVLSLFWPVVQTGINNFGIWIANSSETSPILAPFIYGTLERLLLPVVREGDMVADLCCGSGTAMEAAQSLGCRFVGVDKSPEAILTTASRLECSDLTIDCPCTMDETPLEGEYNGHGGMLLLTGFHAAHPSFPKTEQQLDTLESWSVGKITPEGLQVMQRFRRSRKQPELPWFCVLPEGCGDIAVSTVDAAGRKRVYRWKA